LIKIEHFAAERRAQIPSFQTLAHCFMPHTLSTKFEYGLVVSELELEYLNLAQSQIFHHDSDIQMTFIGIFL